MNTENSSLDFVLHANDACAPAAVLAYAEACNQHGAADVAKLATDQANAMIIFQQTNGSVIPSLPQSTDTGNSDAGTGATTGTTDAGNSNDGNAGTGTTDSGAAGTTDSGNTDTGNSGATDSGNTNTGNSGATDSGNTGTSTGATEGDTGNATFDLKLFDAEIANGQIAITKKV